MKTIRFLRAHTVRDYRAATEQAESYDVGQVVTLMDASAQHWINRGKAVEVVDVVLPQAEEAPTRDHADEPSASTVLDIEPVPDVLPQKDTELEDDPVQFDLSAVVPEDVQQRRRGRPRKE